MMPEYEPHPDVGKHKGSVLGGIVVLLLVVSGGLVGWLIGLLIYG
jgi:hypothetical protein